MVVASGCRVHNAGIEEKSDPPESNDEENRQQNGGTNNNNSNLANNNKNVNNSANFKMKRNKVPDSEDEQTPAKAILICRENSHVFQERTLNLSQPAKIGRSVARARVTTTNAIFDCKVLSRNHALLWYMGGKFYLKDTRSSNGTFVNNQRLSATGLESAPREVCSGDIVQFGVDVMEATKHVTHGCIVATLKLYLPDGKEAKASQAMSVAAPAGEVSLEELYKLNQYVQEATRREMVLQAKLSHLQSLVENTKLATEQSWKALIDEDRLLSRVKTVECQLQACSKNLSEEKIRAELIRMEEEKSQYQMAAKEALRKAHQDKLEISEKLGQLEARLNETEEECSSLHAVSKHAQLELQELAAKYTESQKNLHFMEDKLVEKEETSTEIVKWAMQEKNDLLRRVDEQAKVERSLQARLRGCWLEDQTGPINVPKEITAMRNYIRTLVDLNPKMVTLAGFEGHEVDAIEAVTGILDKLDSMLADIRKEMNVVGEPEVLKNDSGEPEVALQDGEIAEIAVSEAENHEKIDEFIIKPDKEPEVAGKKDKESLEPNDLGNDLENDLDEKRSSLGSNWRPEKIANDDSNTGNDDDSSIASDDTWIAFNEPEVLEKSVLEVIQGQTGLKVKFSGDSGSEEQPVHYESRPREEFAKIAITGSPDPEPSESTEIRDSELPDNREVERDEKIAASAKEDDKEAWTSKTLKSPTHQSSFSATSGFPHPVGEFILKKLIESLDSLESPDFHDQSEKNSHDDLGDDLEENPKVIVRRELENLRDWLLRDSPDNIVEKMREIYYKRKNEAERMREVSEELVILKEKYNSLCEEKKELSRDYQSLKAQCGDLLNASYSVPIQYVAPIAVVLVLFLLEKLF